ncbi:MAG TPA: acetolactate synthase small subunit [Flavisolibacter sp.]|jgi:acetolactate synthase-1/3 small subunit|nr:acetolactate synthase small subunit [Flavisolibacter sp.]
MKKGFTIIILAEDRTGLLVRVAGIFSRRRIVIESLDVAPSEAAGICRFTITVTETEEVTRKLVQQIDKQVDILKTFFYADEEVVWQEQVLYSTKTNSINEILKSGVRYVATYEEYAVFETTGTASSINTLTGMLRPYLTAVVKGGRISMTNYSFLHKELREMEEKETEEMDADNVIV